jgi:hypothetical protein
MVFATVKFAFPSKPYKSRLLRHKSERQKYVAADAELNGFKARGALQRKHIP